MKKLFFIFASITTVIVACSDSGTSSDNSKDTSAVNSTTTAEVADPNVKKGLALVAKSGCFTCHHVTNKTTGPAYTAVAERYPKNQAVIDSLAKKIIHGGSGNWGTIPMTPNVHVTEPDAKIMLEYILSLKK
ncbi:MAG: c-type cytochrome [Flavisolibacter sp.]